MAAGEMAAGSRHMGTEVRQGLRTLPIALVRCEERCKSEQHPSGNVLKKYANANSTPIEVRVVISMNLWAVIYALKTRQEVDMKAH